jgi:hypothetical protein
MLKRSAREPIASPGEVLTAAEKAPEAFRIDAYYLSVSMMRDKGHSWRRIADWLAEFRIEISYVHLRRVFRAESERLARLPRPAPQMNSPAASEDEEKWTRL